MRNASDTGLRIASIVFAAVPFAFALIRAARTGNDFRYLWVAAASLIGAIVTTSIVGADANSPRSAFWLSTAVFIVATLVGTLTALLLGTHLGPGVLIVGAAFGFWFAAGAVLYTRARLRTR